MHQEETTVTFNFFDLHFTPYINNASETSISIMKSSIKKINSEVVEKQKAIVIDRFESRDNESRKLFISSAAYLLKEQIFKCRINLIREGKIPILVNRETYTLTPLNQLGNNTIAESTNFYIDVKGTTPVICCEFNSLGPRISDIEFYFRAISSNKMLNISKACKVHIHMKLPVNEVLESISDVLKFKIKTRPNKLNFLFQQTSDAFISNMNALANTVKPKSIKIDAFFREKGTSSKTGKNNQAIAFVKRVLNAIKKNNEIIDNFEDFTLEFEKEDGSDHIFSLLKGKEEITISCPNKSPGNLDTKELFVMANAEFQKYLENRNNGHS